MQNMGEMRDTYIYMQDCPIEYRMYDSSYIHL